MGGKIERFEDLECWKEARILVRMVYQATSTNPFSKDFGLKDQIQRAAVSVMSNIAEGFETYSDRDFIRFLDYAKRSCAEVQSDLYIASDLEYLSSNIFNEISQQAQKCSRLTKALIRYLNDKT